VEKRRKIIMDMKKILQALDGAATKPVEGVDSMAKFLRVVKEADLNQSAPQQDPNFAKYTELMAKYDMLSAEMAQDTSGLGVEKSASPEFIQQVNNLKAQADALAGPNAQAWDQARKAGGAPQQTNAQLATNLEETDISKFLSIVDKNDVSILNEGKGPLNRLTAAEAIAINHYTDSGVRKDITSPVLNVALGAKPSMIGKYFKSVEEELEEQANRSKERAKQIAERVASKINETPRKSAQVKLQQAWEREQAKSTASRQRAEKAKAEFEKDWKAKQEKEKQGVDEVLGFMINKTPKTTKSSNTSLSTMRKEFEKDKSSNPAKTQRGQDEPKNAKYVRTTTDENKKASVKESTNFKKKGFTELEIAIMEGGHALDTP
jgi:DNA-binding ferritin-like protein